MEMTARLGLPLLAVAQAAKEMTVNEALTLIDAGIQPVVAGEASAPPGAPVPGDGWLVGSGATGAFARKDDQVAIWTAGGWRFLSPLEGMTVWRRDTNVVARKTASGWRSGSSIPAASGGTVIDIEARAALSAIVTILRDAGLTAA